MTSCDPSKLRTILARLPNSDWYVRKQMEPENLRMTISPIISSLRAELEDDVVQLPEDLINSFEELYALLFHGVKNTNVELCQESLLVLGQCLARSSFSRLLSSERCAQIINELCNILKTTSTKTICIRALWCFHSQMLSIEILLQHIETILNAIESALQPSRFSSSGLDYEAIRALTKLASVPIVSPKYQEIYLKILVFRLIHPVASIRTEALDALLAIRSKNYVVVAQCLVNDIKIVIVPNMIRLFKAKQEHQVLKSWEVLIHLLGNNLHSGASLTNGLLEVIELGFRSPISEVRAYAYISWQTLIDVYALDEEIIGNARRLRLLMNPLRPGVDKTEAVVLAKIATWWYLAVSLKLQLQKYFEMVVEPLILYCFGLNSGTMLSGSSNTVADKPSTRKAVRLSDSFALNKDKMIEFGLQIIMRILEIRGCKMVKKFEEMLKIPPLEMNSIANLGSNTNIDLIILKCLEAASISSVTDTTEPFICALWRYMYGQVKSAVSAENRRENSVGFASVFLCSLQNVSKAASRLSGSALFSILELSMSLPHQMLMSSAYSLGLESSLHKTPALLILELLLLRNVGHHFYSSEKFMALFSHLVDFSMVNSSPVLNHIQFAIRVIQESQIPVDNITAGYEMWSCLAERLKSFIEENHEINQGDSLEYDFGCVVQLLSFAVQYLTLGNLSEASRNSYLKLWTSIYELFELHSALVPQTEENVSSILLATKLVTIIEDKVQTAIEVRDLLIISQTILKSVTHSGGENVRVTSDKASSVKMFKPRAKSYELLALDLLMSIVAKSLLKVLKEDPLACEKLNASHSQSNDEAQLKCIIATLVDLLMDLFEFKDNEFIGALIHMIPPLAEMLKLTASSTKSCFAKLDLVLQMESLWEKICRTLPTFYKGPYDSGFLEAMSPLFEASLRHSRENIQLNSKVLWDTTFGSESNELVVSDRLRQLIDNNFVLENQSFSSPEESVITNEIVLSDDLVTETVVISEEIVTDGVMAEEVADDDVNEEVITEKADGAVSVNAITTEEVIASENIIDEQIPNVITEVITDIVEPTELVTDNAIGDTVELMDFSDCAVFKSPDKENFSGGNSTSPDIGPEIANARDKPIGIRTYGRIGHSICVTPPIKSAANNLILPYSKKKRTKTILIPVKSPIRKSLDLNSQDSSDFVLFDTKVTQNAILTSHQEERQNSPRSHIPAMYADLSQDSAPAALNDEFAMSGVDVLPESNLEQLSAHSTELTYSAENETGIFATANQLTSLNSNSILKRRSELICTQSGGSNKKTVSFADPLVQIDVDVQQSVPRYAALSDDGSKRRRLSFRITANDLISNETIEENQDSETEVGPSNDSELQVNESCHSAYSDCGKHLHSELKNCDDDITDILPYLTSSCLEELHEQLLSLNVDTVGKFTSLTEAQVEDLPIELPKLQVTHQALEQYFQIWKESNYSGERDDKIEELDQLSVRSNQDISGTEELSEFDGSANKRVSDLNAEREEFPSIIIETTSCADIHEEIVVTEIPNTGEIIKLDEHQIGVIHKESEPQVLSSNQTISENPNNVNSQLPRPISQNLSSQIVVSAEDKQTQTQTRVTHNQSQTNLINETFLHDVSTDIQQSSDSSMSGAELQTQSLTEHYLRDPLTDLNAVINNYVSEISPDKLRDYSSDDIMRFQTNLQNSFSIVLNKWLQVRV